MRFPLLILPFLAAVELHGAVDEAVAKDFQQEIEPLLAEFCFDCHADGVRKGEISFDEYSSLAGHLKDRVLWERVWENLRAQLMPPVDHDPLDDNRRKRLLSWIEKRVFEIDPANPDPGRVTIRRLNRQEYRYSILDLFGVDVNVSEELPPDDTGYGFDTIGDVLSLSPMLLEKYYETAQQIASEVVKGKGSEPKSEMSGGACTPWFDRRVLDAEDGAEDAVAREILTKVAHRAFRRPVDEGMVDRLVGLYRSAKESSKNGHREALASAIAGILVSPRFLFRAEVQAKPDDPKRVADLDEWALASRLSYFLWSSLPDQRLLDLADRGELRANLTGEVDRMLSDGRSQRFVSNFVGQWLKTRDVETIALDSKRVIGADGYRKFSSKVRMAMRSETEMLFAHLLKENRSAIELLTANYTYLNESLANFYGIEGVRGNEMRKVILPADSNRVGLLTHGSFLLVTSNPTRTSPVKRGLFVLENLLGTPAPPAPPNVPELGRRRGRDGNQLSMREAMEVHRQKAACASCHARMDPIGLALENYSAAGLFRETENGKHIDTAGRLITGEAFEGVDELAQILATNRRGDFYRCLVHKLLTYALGRGVTAGDTPSIDRLVAQMESGGGQMRTLIHAIVESVPFQKRRGDGIR